MDTTIFLGRQPVFDRRQKVFGYELLYRSNDKKNAYDHRDGDQASRAVINNSLNVLPLTDVVGERRAFVNITRQLLVDGTYAVLPRERTVIELLETVEADQEVLAACKALKNNGYMLALDDFVLSPQSSALVEYADILKIDFLSTDANTRRWFVEEFGGGRLMMLAEKVESHSDFEEALGLGYTYFQGYFFCKPEIVAGKDVPALKHAYLRFLQQVNQPTINYDQLEETIKHEVSLSAKLFRYLNSAALGVRHRLNSIKQALALLGEGPLRKWASIVAFSALAEDKPTELLVTCLARARFCELMAPEIGLKGRKLDMFLMGLFSAVDALMDQPLDLLISQIPIPDDVSAALLGANTLLGRAYRLVLAFERSSAPLIDATAKTLNVPTQQAADLFCASLKWADQGCP